MDLFRRTPDLSPASGETRILLPSRWKMLLVPLFAFLGAILGGGLIFFTDCLALACIGWVILGISTLAAAIGLINFSPAACHLQLDPEGLTMFFLLRPIRLKWTHVQRFRTFHRPIVKGITYVVADLYQNIYPRMRSQAINQRIYGYDVLILTNYGLTPERLVDVLNEWKNHYGRKSIIPSE